MDRIRSLAILICLAVALMVGTLASVLFPSVNSAPGETGLAAIGLVETGSLANPYSLPTNRTGRRATAPWFSRRDAPTQARLSVRLKSTLPES